MTRLMFATVAALLAGAPAQADDPEATATMKGSDGAAMGEVEISQATEGLLFRVAMTGLPEGWHAFHVHETGSCADGFAAAGGHYAPHGAGHGIMTADGGHAGDLPNIHVDAEGRAMADIHARHLGLTDGAAPLFDDDGSAIIVHENPDSYGAEAGAGGRLACGEVVMAE